MKPNQAVPYVQQDGRLNLQGMALLTQLDQAAPSALVLPSLTTTERDALAAVAGQIILNSTTGKLNFYTGSAWEAITST